MNSLHVRATTSAGVGVALCAESFVLHVSSPSVVTVLPKNAPNERLRIGVGGDEGSGSM